MFLKNFKHRVFFSFLALFTIVFVSFFVYYSNKSPLTAKLNSINNKFSVLITKPLLDTENTKFTANLFQANLTNYWLVKKDEDENILIKMKWESVFDNIFLGSIENVEDIEEYKESVFRNIEEVEIIEENHETYLQNYWFIEDEGSEKYVQFVKKFDILKWKKQVNVAIFDTWVDTSNKFIKKALLINKKEKRNKKDDDKNWYKDDINWWNFIEWNNDISDKNGHWTHVAGIYLLNPNVKILPVKIVKDSWKGSMSALIKWISYLKDFDIDIINISLWSFEESDILELILNELNKDGDRYFLAAAWNYSTNKEFYPAAYDSVFWICSTDDDWNKSQNSNYWKWVSFCAEGEDIFSFDLNSYFTLKSWTSQSTPIFWLFLSTILSVNDETDRDFVDKITKDFLKKPNDRFINDINYSTENSALKYLESLWEFNNNFNDIDSSTLEWKAAIFLNYLWVINWYPDWTFRWENEINRVEATKILLLAKYWDITFKFRDDKSFVDLSKNQWYWNYVWKATDLWIVSWYDDWSFKPLNNITRAEFLKLFSKTFELDNYWYCPFSDVYDTDWFFKYCWRVKAYNLFPWIWEDYLKPWENITRNDITVAIYKYLMR